MMSQTHCKNVLSWTAIILCAGLLISTATATATAAYTVIDDDLMPSELAVPTHYLVAFPKNGSALSTQGRTMLDALLPTMRGASIRIVGRPDAMVYARGKLAPLASNRANAIRNYLTRQGIAYDSITVEVDDTANPQRNGTMYPTDLYVSRSPERVAREVSPCMQAITPAAPVFTPPVKLSLATALPAKAATLPTYATVALPQQPAVAATPQPYVQPAPIAPVRSPTILTNHDKSTGLAQQATAAPLPQPYSKPAPIATAPVSMIELQEWEIKAGASLRTTLESWCERAGYRLVWNVEGGFRSQGGFTSEGDFRKAVKELFGAIPQDLHLEVDITKNKLIIVSRGVK